MCISDFNDEFIEDIRIDPAIDKFLDEFEPDIAERIPTSILPTSEVEKYFDSFLDNFLYIKPAEKIK